MASCFIDSICARCSGLWEGQSESSKNNEVTTWTRTCLVFRPARAHTVAVEGRGVSRWRDQEISFTVSGSFSPGSQRILLRKQHTGAYKNALDFDGTLDLGMAEASQAPPKVEGSYKAGHLSLQRVGDAVDGLAELLSGAWEGVSVSLKQETTTWSNVSIHFSRSLAPPPSTADTASGDRPRLLSVVGSGFSLWREHQIDFELRGDLDLGSLTMNLTKQHIGRFTNQVQYSTTLDPKKCALEGSYPHGSVCLERTATLPDTPPSQFLGLVEHMRNVSFGVFHPMPDVEEATDTVVNETMQQASVGGLFDGEWAGESIDEHGIVTRWVNTTLRFLPAATTTRESHRTLPSSAAELLGTGLGPLQISQAPRLAIEGQGMSQWRGKTIGFLVRGHVDLATGETWIVKQHTGAYNNVVEYAGNFFALSHKGLEEMNDLWDRSVALRQKSATVQAKAAAATFKAEAMEIAFSQQVEDRLSGIVNKSVRDIWGTAVDSRSLVTDLQHQAPTLCVLGVYPRGKLRLVRRLDTSDPGPRAPSQLDEALRSGQRQGQAAEALAVPSPVPPVESPRGDSEMSDARRKLQKEQQQLTKYLVFLRGVLASGASSGALNANQSKAITDYCEAESISDKVHASAIKALDISQELNEQLSQSRKGEFVESGVDYQKVPDSFLCPITREIMSDPVMCSDGHTYEREAITQWLMMNSRSPKTNETLESKVTIPNHSLRNAIEEFRTRMEKEG
uniref:U-box domain-containing protein n=1 Tax=Rhizochromulina marina TaxID=1034831 RepID=A0A7S2RR37_9STRA|mmetsp:Transcript_19766/g.57702  ORF Transcript_19766/g.57702 Transcript_19766/m.57702 type:complete len:735 (+) Transcript_19766:18-2222(+)